MHRPLNPGGGAAEIDETNQLTRHRRRTPGGRVTIGPGEAGLFRERLVRFLLQPETGPCFALHGNRAEPRILIGNRVPGSCSPTSACARPRATVRRVLACALRPRVDRARERSILFLRACSHVVADPRIRANELSRKRGPQSIASRFYSATAAAEPGASQLTRNSRCIRGNPVVHLVRLPGARAPRPRPPNISITSLARWRSV